MDRDASFPVVEQVEAGDLSVGYADVGPQSGSVVLLLHGWPYYIHSYADVTPMLAAEGYRVVVPHLRGYGSTRFLSEQTPRVSDVPTAVRNYVAGGGQAVREKVGLDRSARVPSALPRRLTVADGSKVWRPWHSSGWPR